MTRTAPFLSAAVLLTGMLLGGYLVEVTRAQPISSAPDEAEISADPRIASLIAEPASLFDLGLHRLSYALRFSVGDGDLREGPPDSPRPYTWVAYSAKEGTIDIHFLLGKPRETRRAAEKSLRETVDAVRSELGINLKTGERELWSAGIGDFFHHQLSAPIPGTEDALGSHLEEITIITGTALYEGKTPTGRTMGIHLNCEAPLRGTSIDFEK